MHAAILVDWLSGGASIAAWRPNQVGDFMFALPGAAQNLSGGRDGIMSAIDFLLDIQPETGTKERSCQRVLLGKFLPNSY